MSCAWQCITLFYWHYTYNKYYKIKRHSSLLFSSSKKSDEGGSGSGSKNNDESPAPSPVKRNGIIDSDSDDD